MKGSPIASHGYGRHRRSGNERTNEKAGPPAKSKKRRIVHSHNLHDYIESRVPLKSYAFARPRTVRQSPVAAMEV